MKILIMLSLILSLGLFSTVNKKNADIIPPPKPETHRPCECSGWFCSAELLCTDAENCSCNCGVFQCKCSCRKDLQSIGHNFTVSDIQILRLYEFETFLNSLSSSESGNLASRIRSMRNNLNAKNYEAYFSDAVSAEESLPSINSSERNSINNWLALKGSDISI